MLFAQILAAFCCALLFGKHSPYQGGLTWGDAILFVAQGVLYFVLLGCLRLLIKG